MSIRCAVLIIWLLLSLLESGSGVAGAAGPRIAVLTSHQAPPYQVVLKSLEDDLQKQVKAQVDVYALYMYRLLFRLFSLAIKQREHLVPHRLVVAQIVT
jgi:hypothetical protein